MKNIKQLAEKTRQIINDKKTMIKSRFEEKYFIRKRGMGFCDIIGFIINKGNTSTQTEINRYFERYKPDMNSISQQAFSKARNHFDHSPFVDLFNMIIESCYIEDIETTKTWCGYYLFAGDGTTLALPNTLKNKEEFGVSGAGNKSATARVSMLLDIQNEVILDVEIGKYSVGEREYMKGHVEKLISMGIAGKSLLILDRGYISVPLIRYLISKGIMFVIRSRSKWNKSVDKVTDDEYIDITDDLTIRAVRVPLTADTYEFLVTNLPVDKFPTELLYRLYGLRWGVETKYSLLKEKVQIEAFSGLTKNSVLQDFWASMFLTNFVLIAKAQAQETVTALRINKHNKYRYQPNVNEIVGSLKNRFIDACFLPREKDRNKAADLIFNEITRAVVPVRNGRSVPRNSSPRKSKFHHNKKDNR